MRRNDFKQAGFTIVEILVAISLLAVLAVILTTTLTGTLKLNQQSQAQLSTSTQAQQLIETIRGAWTDPDQYERACVEGLDLPGGYVAEYFDLDSRAQLQSDAAHSIVAASPKQCSAQPLQPGPDGDPPPLRRIRVKTGEGKEDVTLMLDVLRPTP